MNSRGKSFSSGMIPKPILTNLFENSANIKSAFPAGLSYRFTLQAAMAVKKDPARIFGKIVGHPSVTVELFLC